MALPVIAVTSGEPAGIGPELCLRLVDRSFEAHLVVLADRELLAARAAAAGFAGILRDWRPSLAPLPGVLDVLHLPMARAAQPGHLEPLNSPTFSPCSIALWRAAGQANSSQWSLHRCTKV